MLRKGMDDLFHEIQEDIRLEKIQKFWQSYGNYIVAGLVAVVIISASVTYWRHHQYKVRVEESQLYSAALGLAQDGKVEAAIASLAALSGRGGTYAALADFHRAALLTKQQKTKTPSQEAIKIYEQISRNRSVDAKLRHLATLHLVMGQVGTAEPKPMMELLRVAKVGSNPWSVLNSEMMAVLAHKSGDVAQAKSIYEDLLQTRSTALYSNVRLRAKIMSIRLGSN